MGGLQARVGGRAVVRDRVFMKHPRFVIFSNFLYETQPNGETVGGYKKKNGCARRTHRSMVL